jgi:CheY-like chemotaxis protein
LLIFCSIVPIEQYDAPPADEGLRPLLPESARRRSQRNQATEQERSAEKIRRSAIMIKILLVEDSKFLRLATERTLARAGYMVRSAADGEQALEFARDQQPDLILLDMLLPKMTGPDVLKALKKDPATADIPVVVLSGLSHTNAPRLQHDGAFAFLEKSELGLDKGAEGLLAALRQLLREVPQRRARGAANGS